MNNYDVIIIGGGPAGLSAAIYSSRAVLKTLVIEKDSVGGQIVTTDGVENYPSALDEDTGNTIIDRMRKQAEKFGTQFVKDEVIDFDFDGKIKTINTKNDKYTAKGVIISVGASYRKLGVEGEKEFAGAGVSYCATCDGAFFTDADVYVIGGGDTAFQEALFLTRYAKTVNIVHRRDTFRATKILQEKAKANEKIKFITNSVVKQIKGDGLVGSVLIENVVTKDVKEYFPDNKFNAMGVFVFTGNDPNTEIFKGRLPLNEGGYFVTGEDMKVKDGVYVAGDCRAKHFRQVVTATSDGAIAALELGKYIELEVEG